MNITSDYSLTKLFLSKEINININNEHIIHMQIPTLKYILTNTEWNICYRLLTATQTEFKKILNIDTGSDWDIIKLIIFDLGRYFQFKQIYNAIINGLTYLFQDIDISNQELKIQDVIMTSEIWDYFISILKLSYGEKVILPPTFDSDEAREFYLAQKKNEEYIAALRNKKNGNADPDNLIKCFLSITYAFPSITFDYLYNQTLAQIQWLQKYAAESVSYEVNAQAFAAGNVKKGKKLDFFIK